MNIVQACKTDWHVPQLGQGRCHKMPVRITRTLRPTDITLDACLSAMSVTSPALGCFRNASHSILLQWWGTAYRKLNYVITNTVTLLIVLHDTEAWLEHTTRVFRLFHGMSPERCDTMPCLCFCSQDLATVVSACVCNRDFTTVTRRSVLCGHISVNRRDVRSSTWHVQVKSSVQTTQYENQAACFYFPSCSWFHPVAQREIIRKTASSPKFQLSLTYHTILFL
jgi:hypothetical protein